MNWEYDGNQILFNDNSVFYFQESSSELESSYINLIKEVLFAQQNNNTQHFCIKHFFQHFLDHLHTPEFTDNDFLEMLNNIPNEKLYYILDNFTKVIEKYDTKKEYALEFIELSKAKTYLLLNELSNMLDNKIYPLEETEEGRSFNEILIASVKEWIEIVKDSDNRFYFDNRSLWTQVDEISYLINGFTKRNSSIKNWFTKHKHFANWNSLEHKGLYACVRKIEQLIAEKNNKYRDEEQTPTPNYVNSLNVMVEEIVNEYFGKYYFIFEALKIIPKWFSTVIFSLILSILFLIGLVIFVNQQLITTFIIAFLFFIGLYLVLGFFSLRSKFKFFLYMRLFGILVVGMVPIMLTGELWAFIINNPMKNIILGCLGLTGVFIYLYFEVNNRQRKVLADVKNKYILFNTIILFFISLTQAFLISLICNFFVFDYVLFEFTKESNEVMIPTLKILSIEFSMSVVTIQACYAIIIGVMLQGFWDSKSFIEPV